MTTPASPSLSSTSRRVTVALAGVLLLLPMAGCAIPAMGGADRGSGSGACEEGSGPDCNDSGLGPTTDVPAASATTAATPSTTAVPAPRLVATSPVDSAMEALAPDGTVAVVDGCLGLTYEGGGQQVVSWHRGSELLENPAGVRLPSGRELRVGDVITTGGGGVVAGEEETQACPGVEEVWMLGEVDSD